MERNNVFGRDVGVRCIGKRWKIVLPFGSGPMDQSIGQIEGRPGPNANFWVTGNVGRNECAEFRLKPATTGEHELVLANRIRR